MGPNEGAMTTMDAKTIKVKYVGGFPSGTLEDPIQGTVFPFEKNKPLALPEAVAVKLLSEQPKEGADWIAATE